MQINDDCTKASARIELPSVPSDLSQCAAIRVDYCGRYRAHCPSHGKESEDNIIDRPPGCESVVSSKDQPVRPMHMLFPSPMNRLQVLQEAVLSSKHRNRRHNDLHNVD